MNIAVILSAGSGSRFGADMPKQFLNLAGKNIIEYTIAAFEQHIQIDEICIVANSEFHNKIKELCHKNNFTKVKQIISGGKERKDSSYNAVKAYQDKQDVNLIFHDGVRPFVSQEIISNTIKALQTYDAIDVAIPTADTIIQIDEVSKIIENIPQRSKLQRGQTPQAFKLHTIKLAHEKANEDKNEPKFSDDCGLVLQYLPSTPVYVVDGEEKNIKITYPEDLLFAEKLIQLNSTTINTKYNLSDLKDKVIVVFGGNSGIGKEIIDICKNYGAITYALSRQNGVDINDANSIKKVFADIYHTHTKIDVVINCAAILTIDKLIDMSEESIFNQINTNFTSNVLIAKESFVHLKRTSGHLVLFTSSSYTSGRENYSLYSSTKAAIVNFTQAISKEWLPHHIKVNVINPARTKTKMRSENFGQEDESILLDPKTVAMATTQTILSNLSGLVVDVKLGING